LREKIHNLITEKEEIEEKKEIISNDKLNLLQTIQDMQSKSTNQDNFIKTKELEILQLTNQLNNLEHSLTEQKEKNDLLYNEKENLFLNNKELNDKITMISSELVQEKKLKTQLSIQLQRAQAVTSQSEPLVLNSPSNPVNTLNQMESTQTTAIPTSTNVNNSSTTLESVTATEPLQLPNE
jgi:chromosome segregation ATPase